MEPKTSKGKSIANFIYRLFFTREDGLDMLQLMFLIIIIYFMVAFTFAGMGKWTVSNMAWSAFISIFGTLAITGTPTWIATLLARRDSGAGYVEPDSPPPPDESEDSSTENEIG